ncbi:MAG TPA: hypothetical protein PLZ93_12650 [Nocardioides sp.]|uniref:hypothetical protein n=1 Tax=uncultured Nocardioides sp. TaxID=198441 RepID=UPI000EC65C1B|nr:hypothetical protein [uncultured Nocardioides sp.]HCB04368.1 hypothetical protein [Nocardioides sp.]HRD60801.1 hypothetical protein [Nocardioides sp.]HRI96461.1 hypothetical protein [Nocardioides sp.]HRK44800.1 hypothetical protein [Nocardioides sp.]
MFEIEIQSPTRIRLRVGRLHFRTWKSRLMVLPRGYRCADIVYSVMEDVDGEAATNLGTFYSQKAAEECVEQLRAEGRTGLTLDLKSVYLRPQDWEFNR